MVRHIFAFLLVRVCTDTLVLFFTVVVEGCHDKTPLHASVEMARGKSQLRITQRQGDVNRHIMIADSPRTLSLLPLSLIPAQVALY